VRIEDEEIMEKNYAQKFSSPFMHDVAFSQEQ
jgi:hypothetical protein